MKTRIKPATANGEVKLALPLDTLCSIVSLAREYHVQGASSDPSASTTDDDDIALATLEDRPADPTQAELWQ